MSKFYKKMAVALTGNKLFTIQEVASILGVSTKTLRRWDQRGRFVPIRTAGNQRRYSQEQIDDFLASQVFDPEAQTRRGETLQARTASEKTLFDLSPTPKPARVNHSLPSVLSSLPFNSFLRHHFLLRLSPKGRKEESESKKFKERRAKLSGQRQMSKFTPHRNVGAGFGAFKTGLMFASLILVLSFAGATVLTRYNAIAVLGQKVNEKKEQFVKFIENLPRLRQGFEGQAKDLAFTLQDNQAVLAATTGDSDLILNINVPTFFSQKVGIGTTAADPSAILDLTSEDRGFLAPRMTEAQIKAIDSPAGGLFVYNTDTNHYNMYDGTSWLGIFTSIGDSTVGEAFTEKGTSGTTLWFYDTDGRGKLTTANLSAARTYTLPNADGEISLLGQSISNAELVNSKITVSPGTNLTGGGEVALGSSITLTLKDSVSLAGTLDVAGVTTLAGAAALNGDVTLGNAITDNITFTGRVALDSDLIPIGTTGTNDLGSSALPWDNLYADNVIAGGTSGIFGWLQRNSGALSPTNITDDLLLGATGTSSAKFGFINVAGGNPTATISGNLSLAVPTTAGANTFNLLNNSTLNFQRSPGGDAGLTTALFIQNNGNVGIGTDSPNSLLHVKQSSDAAGGGIRLERNPEATYVDFYIPTGVGGLSDPLVIQHKWLGSGSTVDLVYMGRNGEVIFPKAGSGTSARVSILPNSDQRGLVVQGASGQTSDLLAVVDGNTVVYDTASLGSEKVTNGAFADDTAWSWGTNWAHDAVDLEADHTAGNTSVLEQSVGAVAGEIYQVVFTVKNRTAGSVTPQIGGANGTAVSSNATSTQQIRATGTGNLKFTPTSAFDGSIDDVSVKLIAGGNIKLAGLLTGGGTSGIKVTAGGNVGIGNTTPLTALDVTGSASLSANMSLGGAETAHTFNILQNGTLNFQRSPGGDAGLTTALFIQNNGNVGIGNTDPGAMLSVGSSTQALISSAGLLTIANTTDSTSGSTGSIYTAGGLGVTKDLAVDGGDMVTAAETFNLINTTATTVNFAGASTTLSIGAATGTVTLNNATTAITGALTANGDVTLGNAITDNITFTGRVAQDSDLIPIGTTGTNDLGSLALPWDNLYADNIYSPASGTSGYWQRASAALSPTNITDDLLVGGAATSSAKFGILNMAGGNPTATMSSNLSLIVPTGNAPAATLNLLNNGTLNFQRSPGGDAGLATALFIQNNGNVGIGTTVPLSKFDINGGAAIGSYAGSDAAPSNGLIVSGNVGIKTSTPTTFDLEVGGNIGPSSGSQYDLGSSSRRWNNVYGVTANFTTFSAGEATISGTTTQDFLINSDNITDDAEDASLSFGRGTGNTNSQFKWNSTTKQLSTNTPSFAILPDETIAYSGTSAFMVNQVQNQDIMTASASGITKFVINNSGNVGIGNTTPLTALDVTGSASLSANMSLRGAETAHTFNILQNGTLNFQRSPGGDAGLTTALFIQNNGNVGIGNTTPGAMLSVGSSTQALISSAGLLTIANTTDSTSGSTGSIYTAGGLGVTKDLAVDGGDMVTAAETFNLINTTATTLNIGGAATTLSIGAATGTVTLNNATTAITGALTANGDVTLGNAITDNITFTGRVAQDSDLIPIGTTGTNDLGSLALPWDNLYADNIYSPATGVSGYFQRNNGALSPTNITDDLLLGAISTASAKFAITGVAGTTTTATISGNLSLAVPTTAGANTFNLLNNSTLNFQRSPGGDAGLTTALFIQNNGNVGIGTTTPGAKLELSALSGSNPAFRFTDGDVSQPFTAVGFDPEVTASTFAQMSVVDSNVGGLGINGFTDSNSAAALALAGYMSSSSTTVPAIILTGWKSDGSTGRTAMTTTDLVLQVRTGASPLVTIQGGGNVGIGTTSPLATLDVRGNLGTTPAASVSATSSFASLIVDNSGIGDLFTASKSGATKFVITNAGNVGIGTANPSSLLDVNGTLTATTINAFTLGGTIAGGGNQINNIVIGASTPLAGTFTTLTANGDVTLGDEITDNITFTGRVALDSDLIPIGTTGTNDLGSLALPWDNLYADNIYSPATGTSGYWQRASGALSPTNITDDLLLGATSTASAKFAITGVAGTTTTATISGNLSLAVPTTAGANTFNLLNNSTLNFQRSPGGDGGLTTALFIQNNGKVGIGTTGPSANLHIYQNSPSANQVLFQVGTSDAATRFSVDEDGDIAMSSAAVLTISDNLTMQGGKLQVSTGGTGTTYGLRVQDHGLPTSPRYSAYAIDVVDGSNVVYAGILPKGGAVFNEQGLDTDFRIEGDNDTALFFVDASTDRVGIGTTSPLATLDVRGNLGTTPAASVSATSSFASLIVDNSGIGDLFTASKSGATKFVITNSGNVGIGTANPSSLLNVNGTLTATTINAFTLGGTIAGGGNQLNNIIIGTSTPLAGTFTTLTANGDTTLGDNIADNITFTGRVAQDSDLIPIGTTGTNDLGSLALPWDNLYADNIYSPASGTSGYWQRASAALSPTNITDDLLLGATSTASAKFGFINMAGGNPTATISGNLSLAVPTTAGANTFNLLNNSTLNFQRSPGGDAGLTTALFIQNNGNVGIGTITPGYKLTVSGQGSFSDDVYISGNIYLTGASRTLNANAGDLTLSASAGNDVLIGDNATILYVDGGTNTIGVGAAATSGRVLNLDYQLNNLASADSIGAFLQIRNYNIASDNANYHTGAVASSIYRGSANLTNTAALRGLTAYTNIDTANAGTITGAAPIFIQAPAMTGTGYTVTSNYGIYMESMAHARVSTSYGIYQTGTGDINYFAGNVGIGTTSPLATLDVRGNLGTTPAASVSATSSFASLIVDNSGIGDLFTASKSGATKFVITNSGNVGIGTANPSSLLNVNGTLTATTINAFTLGGTIAGGGNQLNNIIIGTSTPLAGTFTTLTANGDTTLGDNIADNITFTGRVAQDSDLIPIGTTGTNDLGSLALPWDNLYADNIYSPATGVSGYFQRNNGALSPTNITDDLLLGAISTASAKFAITGVAGTTTTATISGNLSLAVPTTAGANTFNLLNNSTLNFQRSPGGDGGLTTALFIQNNGNVGIGTTEPGSKLSVDGDFEFVGAQTLKTTTGNLTLSAAAGADVLIGDGTTILYVDGGTDTIGMFAAANSAYALYNTKGFGDVGATSYFGEYTKPHAYAAAADTAAILTAIEAHPLLNSSNTKNWTATVGLRALTASIEIGGGAAGTVTGAAGLYVSNVNSANVTLTNQYGLYIEDLTKGVSDYGIYVVGADTAAAYFGDKVGIGNLTPLTALDITGSASLSANLSLGGAETAHTFNILDNGTLNIQRSPGGDGGLTTALFIQNNGNVGIGTTGPIRSLHVIGPQGGGLAIGDTLVGTDRAQIIGYSSDYNAIDMRAQEGTQLWLATDGNIGIGNTTPLTALDVTGSASLSANLSLRGAATAHTLNILQNGTLNFQRSPGGDAGLTTALFIQNNGNVGIGTTTPSAPLEINKNQNSETALLVLNANTGTAAENRVYVGSATSGGTYGFLGYYGSGFTTNGMQQARRTIMYGGDTGGLTLIAGNDAGIMTFGTGGSAAANERVRIDSTGNVGIGNTTPLTALDVTGSASLSANLSLRGAATAHTLNILQNGTLNFQRSPGGDAGLTTALFIQNNGNVGIGTTGPNEKLEVSGNIRITGTGGINLTNTAAGTVPNTGVTMTAGTVQNNANSLGWWLPLSSPGNYQWWVAGDGNPLMVLDRDADGIGRLAVGKGSAGNTALTGLLEVGSGKLFVSTAGNVGIGNTTPLTALDVTGSASLSANLSLRGAETAHTFNILDNGTLNLQRSPGGDAGLATALFIQNNGNVGIGTTAPGAKLGIITTDATLYSPTTAYSPIITQDNLSQTNGAASFLRLIARNANNYGAQALLGVISESTNSKSTFVIQTRNAGDGFTEKFRIDTSGNVGIGTTSPLATLDVRGNLGTTPAASISATSSFASLIVDNSGIGDLFTASKSGATKFVITNAGNVGIGTTNPTNKLDVSGTANATTLTEGGNAVYNSTEVPGGELGGTWASPTIDDSLAVTSWTLTTPIFSGIVNTDNNWLSGDGGAEGLMINDSGNVGIGTTGPLAKLHAGDTVSDYHTLSFANTGAVISSVGADHDQARSNVLTLMRDGVTGVRYAGAARFDMSKWASDGVNARTQLDVRLANTETSVLTDVLSLQSSGNVGIGNTAPLTALDVTGSASLSANLSLRGAATAHTLNILQNGTLNFQRSPGGDAGLTTALFIQNNGNVGIGNTTPLTALDITGSASLSANLSLRGAGTAHTFDLLDNGTFNFRRSPGGDGGLATALFIQNNGNVGIGTTAPATLLSLANDGWLSGVSTASGQTTNMFKVNTADQIQVGAALNVDGGITFPTDGGYVTAMDMPFSTTGTNAYVFRMGTSNLLSLYGESDSVGAASNLRVGIGTRTPLLRLDVQDSQDATAAAQIYNTSTNVGADGLILKLGNTSTSVVPSTNHFLSFETFGIGIVGSVQGNGGKGVTYATSGIADFAEYFKKDQGELIPFGSVVCLKDNGLAAKCDPSAGSGQGNIIGVASEHPAFLGGDNLGDRSVPVGLVGQVKTRVSTANGEIKIGDPLTTSNTPGVAVKATTTGQILGKAIEAYDGQGEGSIRVSVNIGWYNPSIYVSYDGTLAGMAATVESIGDQLTLQADILASQGLALQGQAASISASLAAKIASDAAAADYILATDPLFDSLNNKVNDLQSRIDLLSQEVEQQASISAFLTEIVNAQVLGASTSAILDLGDVELNSATIAEDLMVLGRATVTDLGVTGNINAGLLAIHGLEAEINTLSGNLYLQKSGLGGLDILDGKIVIDTLGNMTVIGTITADEIKADNYTVLGDQSIGSATIPAGLSSIEISTPVASGSSKIFLTPTSLTDKQLIVVNKSDGKFKVAIPAPATAPITFDWWIVGNK